MEKRNITLGNLTLSGYAALAPMAGVADRSMRRICINEGACFCISELTSAMGVHLNDKKSCVFLKVTDYERPIGVQLFGYSPEILADAATKALEEKPDFIDINMGCPAPKVSSNGSGSALMKNPQLAGQIVAAVKKNSTVPVTVKMRSGWDDNNKNAVEIAKICESEGADMITVHGRTKIQGYRPPADLDIIAEVKNAINIPVIGNGDIFTVQDAKNMYEYTGCDMIMIGRGACGKPWFFNQVNSYLKDGIILPDPNIETRLGYLLKQAEYSIEEKGEKIALLQLRKHAAWYIKGIRGAASFREQCGQISSLEDLNRLINNVTSNSID